MAAKTAKSSGKSASKPAGKAAGSKVAKATTAKPAAKAAAKPAKKAAPAKPAAKAAKPKAEKPVVEIAAEPIEALIDDAEAVVIAKPAKPVKEKKVKVPKAPRLTAAQKALSEDNRKWGELKIKHGEEKAQTYSMSGEFESEKPLNHKVLGWGWVLNVQNDRLEVLFETGTKFLISNYKPR